MRNIYYLLVGVLLGLLFCAIVFLLEIGADEYRRELEVIPKDRFLKMYQSEIQIFYCEGAKTSAEQCEKTDADVYGFAVDEQYYVIIFNGGYTLNTVYGRKPFFSFLFLM